MTFMTEILDLLRNRLLPDNVRLDLRAMNLEVFPPYLADDGRIMVRWALTTLEGHHSTYLPEFEVFPNFVKEVTEKLEQATQQARAAKIAQLKAQLAELEAQEC